MEVSVFFLSGPALLQSFLSSSFVGQAVVILLLLISVLAWSVMAVKFQHFGNVNRQNNLFLKAFRKESHPFSLHVKQKRYPESPDYRIYFQSCRAAARSLDMGEADIGDILSGTLASNLLTPTQLQIIREAAERELAEEILLMEKDLSLLATCTTIAPFMGLLGTVWGVMEAFNAMGVTGAPTLSTVAPGISAALLTTVVGLIVAIPTVIAYNVLSVRLRNITVGMDNFVQELVGELHHAYVKEG
jgi:biopolymer transport protein TolQ